MGGNIKVSEVPHLPQADRMTREQYEEICSTLHHEIYVVSKDVRHSLNYAIPDFVKEKESHGDVDLLVGSFSMDHVRKVVKSLTWVDPATGKSYLNQVQHPDSATSYLCTFVVDGVELNVQVDLNKQDDGDAFVFGLGYFSYNDLGNLIGRIAHRRGMKFGHDGLWYVHRHSEDKVLGEILVTLDFLEALRILGFDSMAFSFAGAFDTFEQMFQWVKNSKYFESCAYPLENQNHRARTRDRKRATYNKFLEWLGDSGEYVKVDRRDRMVETLTAYDDEYGTEFYLGMMQEIARLDKADAFNQAYKEKVNGIIVRDLLGYDGKELGAVMQVVRRVLPPTPEVLKYSEEVVALGIKFAEGIYLTEKGLI